MNKKILLPLIALGVLCIQPAEARRHKGEHPDFPPRHEDRMEKAKEHDERLAKELGLTAEQKAKADEIRENSAKKMDPIFEQMKKLRKELDAIRKENKQEFEKLLTPEQREKFDSLKKDRKKKHPRKPMED